MPTRLPFTALGFRFARTRSSTRQSKYPTVWPPSISTQSHLPGAHHVLQNDRQDQEPQGAHGYAHQRPPKEKSQSKDRLSHQPTTQHPPPNHLEPPNVLLPRTFTGPLAPSLVHASLRFHYLQPKHTNTISEGGKDTRGCVYRGLVDSYGWTGYDKAETCGEMGGSGFATSSLPAGPSILVLSPKEDS